MSADEPGDTECGGRGDPADYSGLHGASERRCAGQATEKGSAALTDAAGK